ncbi:MAG: HAMP domain-containing histidine kinase [Candidatus Thorarchaeota archaeon]|nr:HAMP domain-containing histidine kinase [Candidatus Thorarchaeota archaeon]
MSGGHKEDSSKNDPQLEEKQRELERNSIYYTQLRYILGELLRSSDPNTVLAAILQEIATLTGGIPSLAIEFHSGIWELFSLRYFVNQSKWVPRYLVNNDFYNYVVEQGEIYYNIHNPDRSISNEIKHHLDELDAKSILFYTLEGTPRMVIEVSNVIIPDRIERYLEAVREFVIPLRLSIQHAMLLEDSNRARRRSDLLLDLLFHDIRGSIGNLSIALELMEMKWDDHSKLYPILQDAMNQASFASNLLNRVRRVLTAKGDKDLEPCNLESTIAESISTIRTAFPEKKLDIQVKSRSEKQHHVLANELLHDVFQNLITNAIKSMNDRDDEIVIEIDEWKSDSNIIRVGIIDKGMGMPEELKPKMSGRFLTESTDGIGLGLSIVMRLLEDFGGYLWFENRVPDDWKQGTIANIALHLSDEP